MRSVDGGFSLPVGSYAMDLARVQYPTPQGTWRISFLKRDGKDLIVEAGKTTELPIGPPFKLNLQISEFSQKYSFKLTLSDGYGNIVKGILNEMGKHPSPPKLQIVDAEGKVLDSQEAHYG